MRRVLVLLPLLLSLAGPAAVSASSAPARVRTVTAGASTDLASSARFARFGGGGSRGFFGGSSRSRGGGLFGGRRRGVFGNRGRSRGLFSRIARALAFAYIFHLLFTHGGLSIVVWIGLIALIVSFTRRRRRRRMAY